MLNENFEKYFEPGEIVCVDESLIPFRGRIVFNQYIKQKRHKYGIKIFKLCATPGYTLAFKIYCEKKTDIEKTTPTNVVLSLCKSIFGKGHTICTDNWYTSIELARKLVAQNTHLVGTIRSNRRGIPKDLLSKKLKRYEYIAKESNDDISEQMASYCSPLRKSVKWYKEIELNNLLKSFIDGTAHFIRTELRTSGSQDLTDAIANAIAIETSITPNPQNLSYNRSNSNRNPGGRYEKRYTNTENRTYRFNYNQNHRYPDQQPQYADRNNDNFNRMDNRNNYNNNQTRKFYNDRNLDHENKRFDRYQNPQTRFPPEERRGYHNQNYRDQRPGDYKEYNMQPNQRSQNVGNAYSPPSNYEPNKFNSRMNAPPAGVKAAQVDQSPPEICRLCNTDGHKTKDCPKLNTPALMPINFTRPGDATDRGPEAHASQDAQKDHVLTPGVVVSQLQERPLQGIADVLVETLGTTTLRIFSYDVFFHIIPSDLPIPGDGVLGDEFFALTDADVKCGESSLEFQNMCAAFQEDESIIIGARETRKVEVFISTPQVEIGILERREPVKGVYFEEVVVKPEKGKATIDVVNDTDNPIIMKIPSLTIIPLKERVNPVVGDLGGGGITSGVNSRAKKPTMGDKLSENEEIGALRTVKCVNSYENEKEINEDIYESCEYKILLHS
ncbi:hypothetical protein M0802_011926 [Mischocyttarus mexicanus]|nr:hypothetical protein M0802_011926 [Mischocyttarus mexicanus]